MPAQSPLSLRLLGEIELRRGSRVLPLPPSKKTRVLLAYLALAPRPHRRERLCSLLWDVTDDPRAALRWSLSKLRPLVDDEAATRLRADRDSVSFSSEGAWVDALALRAELATGTDSLSTERLVAVAREFRGELLEGLELPGFLELQAWCVAQREEMRRLHVGVLRALVARTASQPEEALLHARALVHLDPLDEDARAELVRLLLATDRRREAEEHVRSGKQIARELHQPLTGALERAWNASHAAPASSPEASPPPRADTAAEARPPLIGRTAEMGRLLEILAEVASARRERVLLLTGEPGVGKSRLLAELMDAARLRGGTVLDGCAYEVETGRPYGAWVDALRRLPATTVGATLGPDLAPLLPELGGSGDQASSRERLFGGIVELLAARAHSAPPVLIVLDDAQWCDDASAELLHYVTRMHRHRPILVAIAARAGELLDNTAMCRVLRALRREALLTEMRLGPLARAHIEALARASSPSVDVARIWEESGGNPLFALEAARAERAGGEPATLAELVRERCERLPADAAHVLRWAAVLGPAFTVERLGELAPLDPEALVEALEQLERHALLRSVEPSRADGTAYAFAHDIVRKVIYGDLSAPRRRLMHQRIAASLQPFAADDDLAAEVAHHAALAGEESMAARACVAAARRCLRVFANIEAEALARRGMHHAERAAEEERSELLLELYDVALDARRPEQLDETARRIAALADDAAARGRHEAARLGFHMVAWLRWEHGEWSAAQRFMLQAEKVSRSGDEKDHLVASAEAARCLAILERDLQKAESLLLEAAASARQLGVEPMAIEDGLGLLRQHQGQRDEARRHFERARGMAQQESDHEGEFQALAHLLALEIDGEDWSGAQALAAELSTIAARLRGGSEGPFAEALAALCAGGDVDAAIERLRFADAKHRLAFVLTRAGQLDLAHGDAERALARGEEAARAAAELESASEHALALVLQARAGAALGREIAVETEIEALTADAARPLSAHARAALTAMRSPVRRRARKRR